MHKSIKNITVPWKSFDWRYL